MSMAESHDEITPGNLEEPMRPAPIPPIPYDSARWRVTVVIGLFGFGILLAILMLVVHFQQFYLMERIGSEQPFTEEEIEANYIWQFGLSLLWLLWYLITIVAFLMWTHRAHRNLPSLDATELEFTPPGAAGWYFVPFLNLFKPYQAMREIYNASVPSDSHEGGSEWRRRNAPALVKTWWALFLFMNFVSNAVLRAELHADTAGAYQFVAAASMVDCTISIAAMLAAASMAWSITRRQDVRASHVGVS
jgi:Domain of unknown function (DUF4328)